MSSEERLFKKLKKSRENKVILKELRKRDASELHDKAIKMIEEIEEGNLENSEIARNVEKITLLFGAIVDAERDLVKVKFLDKIKRVLVLFALSTIPAK